MSKLRKMLWVAGSPDIMSLMRNIETQSKTTITNWFIDYFKETLLTVCEHPISIAGRGKRWPRERLAEQEDKAACREAKHLCLPRSCAGSGIKSRRASRCQSLRTGRNRPTCLPTLWDRILWRGSYRILPDRYRSKARGLLKNRHG